MSPFRRRHVGTVAARLAEGWNGLVWGAPLSAFKARFPRAQLTDSDWWRTGAGTESFCGVPMAITQYAFNARDELFTIAFIPATADRDRLSVAAINELGAPDGMDLRWTAGDVVVTVKLAGVLAIATHPTYSDR